MNGGGGGGGGGGRAKMPALTLNVYNCLNIQPNTAKLCEFIKTLSGNNLVRQVVSWGWLLVMFLLLDVAITLGSRTMFGK